MALDTDLTKYSTDLTAAATVVDKATFQIQTYPQLFGLVFTSERMAALKAELNALAAAFGNAATFVVALKAMTTK
jgi:hypothetical protein